jgi:hypothetical protein
MKKPNIKLREVLILVILNLIYLYWFYGVVGFRTTHFFIVILADLLYILGGKYRKYLFAILPFMVYLTAYDSLRAFPNYQYNELHIKSLYDLEKSIFGIYYHGNLVTVNEFFYSIQHSALDIISGLAYLTWVPVPMLFALYLYGKNNKKVFINFSLLFVITNFLGFAGYFIYPAAPPWYVEICGFEYFDNVHGEASRLANFDNLVGIPIFRTIYENNANVFAAVPSIHAANPLTCFIAGIEYGNRWLSLLFGIITTGMWFGAVYGNHHYVIDVLSGVFVVLVATIIVYGVLRRNRYLNALLVRYQALI